MSKLTKKLFLIGLISILLIGLVGCSKPQNETNVDAENVEQQTEIVDDNDDIEEDEDSEDIEEPEEEPEIVEVEEATSSYDKEYKDQNNNASQNVNSNKGYCDMCGDFGTLHPLAGFKLCYSCYTQYNVRCADCGVSLAFTDFAIKAPNGTWYCVTCGSDRGYSYDDEF